MNESRSIEIAEMFGGNFPATQERLQKAYQDDLVHSRFQLIKEAPTLNRRKELQAQLSSYLAAAYILFPEEAQIIYDSIPENFKNAK